MYVGSSAKNRASTSVSSYFSNQKVIVKVYILRAVWTQMGA